MSETTVPYYDYKNQCWTEISLSRAVRRDMVGFVTTTIYSGGSTDLLHLACQAAIETDNLEFLSFLLKFFDLKETDLHKWIAANGKHWRAKLCDEWLQGSTVLRQLRNTVGPSGLYKITNSLLLS